MNNDLLRKYLEGNATQQEKDEIARWIDADEKNLQEYRLQRQIYDAAIWSESPQENTTTLPAVQKSRRFLREFIKIASVFLITLATSWMVWMAMSQDEEDMLALRTVYVPEGQRAEVTLNDGSKVWINAKSSISFPERFASGERRVKLNGEAYFDIARDETKQFIVQTKDYQVTVLGTEFNVNAYEDSEYFETTLVKGSVEVESVTTNEKVRLSPDMRVYVENNEMIVSAVTNHDLLLWKNGIMAFEDKSVKEIFQKLELYYDVTINVENADVLEHTYTGKFWTKDGVEHVLRVLQYRHNFTYTKDNMNNITIR